MHIDVIDQYKVTMMKSRGSTYSGSLSHSYGFGSVIKLFSASKSIVSPSFLFSHNSSNCLLPIIFEKCIKS